MWKIVEKVVPNLNNLQVSVNVNSFSLVKAKSTFSVCSKHVNCRNINRYKTQYVPELLIKYIVIVY